MSEITVRPFEPKDADGVIAVILPIQREEFGFSITAEDQPDLSVIPDFYQTGKGGFWVAEKDGKIVGTIGLKDIGNDQATLRKMFVAAAARGREHGTAARLLEQLFAHATETGLSEIFLGTTERFLAAHRFYEKHGFAQVDKADLPEAFLFMKVDTRFYKRGV
ncbi:N-acetylglutamate synthase-like GNAT family acetyltransferase [Neorhizobium huautlense]|uniref:N-acetylglutamate synthase-like GNAT family acetyltransferase n=1 Tax=Neorhizobium huautlense TaxID=67774 RepID=A0ABT9PV11_9HYPH|nr:GNAT family N-acetyltransferase [Neorhizobium huautlense]MDP9838303.1 N-acetylglutamate synthase-like GNAT family acetyltransferase [Neorhizobium huautlense]